MEHIYRVKQEFEEKATTLPLTLVPNTFGKQEKGQKHLKTNAQFAMNLIMFSNLCMKKPTRFWGKTIPQATHANVFELPSASSMLLWNLYPCCDNGMKLDCSQSKDD